MVHSGAQDASSSQLMEAKHQLNQLHQYVMDLVIQVNTTERAIVALDKAMEDELPRNPQFECEHLH